jgi:hypothetical protein
VATTVNEENIGYDECQMMIMEEGGRMFSPEHTRA